ncbi:MAG: undecaprenyl/decaprenyl-phosphate alpha-N-acetylglucosaminyl 1-phosphate transferase [Proteobacteria bacterium]|nr:undecaprenyl/decaprenyl-phosphate alpha-N-acetylglucosaminyl 1-phosphate transferase [Pseudomonadota bacterium]
MPALATLAAFVISLVLIVALRRAAPTAGLLDRPGGRKLHASPVPVVGGLAMFIAILPFIVAAADRGAATTLAFALAILVGVGFLDDRFLLRPRYRFVAEFGAAMVLVWGGQSVAYLGDLIGFGAIHTGVFGAAFSVACYVGLINAVNMIDGLDGLAGALMLIALVFFTAVAGIDGNAMALQVGLAAIGALVAFLLFNLRTPWRARAAVFMGDAGSMMLGCLVAWFAIVLAGRLPAGTSSSSLTPIGAVWVLAVPLLDMGSVMLHRIRRGRSPFDGDRRHLHYRMVDSGISVTRAVATLAAAAVACGFVGIGFPRLGIPEWVMFYAFIAAWFLAYRAVSRAPTRPASSADTVMAGSEPVFRNKLVSDASAFGPDKRAGS